MISKKIDKVKSGNKLYADILDLRASFCRSQLYIGLET